MFGRQAITDLNDGWLRLNQSGNYSNGLYSPGYLRIDGGIVSGAGTSLGGGSIVASQQIQAPIFYDLNNTAYYLDPASTSNLNVLRFNIMDCMNGFCPPNNVIRYTPNLHFNSFTGNAVIVNWDNGTSAASNVQQFRVGTGTASDAFYVTSAGNVVAIGNINGASFNTAGTFTGGSIIVDNANLNAGTTTNGLTFGNASGEGIGSRRNAGVNQYGLDFYTGFAQRMNISQGGLVGIGNNSPGHKLHVTESTLGASTVFSENISSGTSDGLAVYGRSVNNPGYGYGGYFEGGYKGIHAQATTSNYSSLAYGVYSLIDGTAGSRIGVEGVASTAGASTAYGIYGTASGAAVNYGVYCSGSGGYTGTWSSLSDQKLKTDINDYNGALSKVLQLSPKTYYFKTQEYSFMNLPEGEQIGLVAQDVQKVFPQLVENGFHPGKTDSKSHENNNPVSYKSMNYIGLTPILVEAIKEQEQIIDGLKSEIEMLKTEFEKFKNEKSQGK